MIYLYTYILFTYLFMAHRYIKLFRNPTFKALRRPGDHILAATIIYWVISPASIFFITNKKP